MSGSAARLLRAAARGTAAALVAGLLAGVLMRLLMRAVVLVGDGPGHVTLAGTVSIVVLHVVLVLPGAIALATSSSWWPWVLVGAGMALLLTAAVGIGLEEVDAVPGLTGARQALLAVVVAAMAATYAGQVVLLARLARGRRR